jgi:molecular chaperone DnaK (HSP70)
MIGINIGSLNTSIAFINKNKAIEMLLSETSKRSFPSLISFPKEERLYGDNAMFSLKTNLETSLESPTRFLSNNIEDIEEERKFCLGRVLFNNENNATSPYIDTHYLKLNLVQVNAAYLSKIDSWISSNSLYNSKECSYITISVPDFYTLRERYNLLKKELFALLM